MADSIAVVGGGWAGIAAAVALTAAGRPVTLYEAGRVLGGRARSIQLAGHTLENGQHLLLGAYRDTLALMQQVGADPERLLQRRPLTVADNSGFRLALPRLPAPLNLAAGLFAAKGVGWREKLRTALWMQGLKWHRFRLATDQTVAEWLATAGQKGQLVDHLWAPLCLAALNTPIERASAQVFANVLRDSLGGSRRSDTDLLLPTAPLGEVLPEPAARWLTAHGAEICQGHRVRELVTHDDGVRIDGREHRAAIVATAPQHAGALLGDRLPAHDCAEAFEPIATAYLACPPGTRLPEALYGQNGGLGQWAVDRGDGLVACVLSGHGDWEALDDETLAAALADELRLPAPLWHGVVREKRATFSCRPSLRRPGAATVHPRLWLAGDYTWADYPATLEGAVRSGLYAAKLCVKSEIEKNAERQS